MRPLFAAFLLPLTMSACTIREESFARKSDEPSSGLSLVPAADLNTPVRGERSSCPGGFARSSDMQDSRDGTQDFFCD